MFVCGFFVFFLIIIIWFLLVDTLPSGGNATPALLAQVHASPCCFACSRSCCWRHAESRPAWGGWWPHRSSPTTRKVAPSRPGAWAGVGRIMQWQSECFYTYKQLFLSLGICLIFNLQQHQKLRNWIIEVKQRSSFSLKGSLDIFLVVISVDCCFVALN